MAKVIVTGVIKEITQVESGISQSGRQWSKCDVVITEQNGQYDNDIALTAFGSAIDMLSSLGPGAYVQAEGWASSAGKDKDGKIWYHTKINLNRISLAGASHFPPQSQVYPQQPQQAYQQPPTCTQQGYPQPQGYSQVPQQGGHPFNGGYDSNF